MEEKKEELSKPMSVEEFKEKIHQHALKRQEEIMDDFENGILHLRFYDGVRKFKSIRRAIRRGHVSIYGEVYPKVYPKRPFKNISTKFKKNGRVLDKHTMTFNKKRIYEQFTGIGRRVC